MKNTSLFILLAMMIACFSPAMAQLPANEIQKIDSLFVSWNQPNHPGGVAGIMKDGKMVYCKAYGLASLEYLVPNSPGTLFNIASVSKQFTSMGIVLLDLQGKLSIDEDVRVYLPEMPGFGHKITLRHFMHHTSGMRSLHAMLEMAGWREDDSRDNKDLVRFVKKQKELNFKPGDEYLYCNTGYILMAEVIEKVTGEKFPEWMKKNIFAPLDMIYTYVEDDYSRVVPNNATSYYGSPKSGFSRAVEYWGYVGSGNMHSTAEDLLKWSKNFYAPPTGWEEPFKMLQTLDPLNDGSRLDYAFGVGIDTFENEIRISHGGSIGGYRSDLAAFPEKKMSVVVLANFSSAGPGQKADQIARIILGKDMENKTESLVAKKIRTITLPKEKLEKFAGMYWNEKESYSRKIYLKNDTLRYHRSEGNESSLLAIEEGKFLMDAVEDRILITFNADDKNKKQMLVQVNDQKPLAFDSYQPLKITNELLQTYVGRYYSPELETHYTIMATDGKLTGYHYRHGEFEIELLRENGLQSSLSAFRTIKVKRDEGGKILGIYVTNGRVRNLWFEKES